MSWSQRSARQVSAASTRWRAFFLALLASCGGALAVIGTTTAAPTCTIYWTGATSGDWSTTGNWSLTSGGPTAGRVPKSTDYVCFSTAPARSTVTLTAASASVAGISWPVAGAVTPTLTISQQLNIGTTTPSSVAGLTVSGGGILKPSAALTVTNLTVADGGEVDGPGTVTVDVGGTLNLTPTAGYTYLSGGARVVNKGTATVGASASGYLNYLMNGARLDNQGTLNLAAGARLVDGGGSPANQMVMSTGSTVASATTDTTIEVPTTFNGAVTIGGATVTLAAGTSTLANGASLSGAGTLRVQSSSLQSVSGGAATVAKLTIGSSGELDGPGTVTIPSGGAFKLDTANGYTYLSQAARLINKGTTTVLAGTSGYVAYAMNESQIDNQGTFTMGDQARLIDGGGSGLSKLINSTGSTISAATDTHSIDVATTFNGAVTVGGSKLFLTSGQHTLSNGAVLSGSGTLVVSSTISGVTGGAATVGKLTLQNNGTIQGPGTVTVPAGGALKFDTTTGYTYIGSDARLVNKGTASVVAGSSGYVAYVMNGGQLDNQGTFALGEGTNFTDGGGSGTGPNMITNSAGGTTSFAGATATSTAFIGVPFVNKGAVNVTKGIVQLGSSPTSSPDTGVLNPSSGAKVQLIGARQLGTGATVTGAGLLELASGGTLAPQVAITIPQLLISNGNLSGPGTVTIPATGSVKFDTTNGYNYLDADARLVNKGAASLVAGTNGYVAYLINGGQLDNQGTLTLSEGGNFVDGGGTGIGPNTITNSAGGTTSFAGSTTTSAAYIGVPFVNKGAVNVTKGILQLASSAAGSPDTGALNMSSGAKVQLVGTRQLGTGATVTGAGVLELASGGTLVPQVAVTIPQLTITNGALDGPGALTVPVGGTLKFDTTNGYNYLDAGARLVNKGAASLIAGTSGYVAYLENGSQFDNQGTLTLTDGGNFADGGGGPDPDLITNSAGGTTSFAGSTTTSTAYIGVPFVNKGTVSVTKGILQLASSPASTPDTGSLSLASGTKAAINGVRLFGTGATVTGAGVLDVVAGGGLTPQAGVNLTVPQLTLENFGTLDGPGTITVPAIGTLKLDTTNGYVYLDQAARLVNQGTATITAGTSGFLVYFANDSQLDNQGSLSLGNGTVVNDGGGTPSRLVNSLAGTLTFNGSTSAQTASIGIAVTNSGRIWAAKGNLTLYNLASLASGELLPGTYDIDGTLTIPAAVTKNSAAVTLGTSGVFTDNSTSTGALSTLATNAGTLTLRRTLSVGSAVANSGNVNVTAGVFNPTSYSQSAGTTTVSSGATLKSGSGGSGPIAIAGGVLTGNGIAQGAVSGAGTFTPGSAAGPLAVTGTFAPAAAGTTSIRIAGPSVIGTDFGQLAASGAATLNGKLAINTATGYLPPLGTQYTFLKAASFTGAFSSITGAVLSDRQYVLSSTATTRVLTVKQAPSFTSPATGTAVVGTAASITIASKGYETPAITMSGALPAGMSFVDNADGTATLSGTPLVGNGGTYPLTFTSTNGVGSPATQSFVLTVNEAPAVTSAASTSFTTGTAGSFGITTRGFPKPTLSSTGTLPSGVTFSSSTAGTATLSGTPAAGTGGSYPITIKADNGTAATQSFVLTVRQAPAFTSATSTTFTTGTAGAFTIATSGFPQATIAINGALPSGVTFTAKTDGTATLTGTPAAGTGGSYPLSLSASNGVGTAASQSFTLVVKQPPAFTSAASKSFVVGTADTFTVTTTGSPTAALSSSGTLPSGVTFVDNGDGTATLSGSPATGTAAAYPLTLTATSSAGTTTQTFALDVNQVPAITTSTSGSFGTNVAGTFTVRTTGRPAPALTVTGTLPSGLTFTDNGDGTGKFAGTATAVATVPLTIKATNSAGNATQSFTLYVKQSVPPTITSPDSHAWAIGTAGTHTFKTSGFPTPTLTRTGTLPSGLTWTTASGVTTISGTPAAGTAGSYPLTVTATNGAGTAATQTFTIKVGDPAAPAFTSATSATFPVSQARTFSATTTGFPSATLTLTGSLPSGLTFTNRGDGSATISGTPAAGTVGAYTVTVTASNGVGTAATSTITINVINIPGITSANATSFTTTLPGTFKIIMTGDPKPTASIAGALPSGVTLTNNGNGVATLAGTPAATAAGTYPLTITANNGPGSEVTQAFTLTVRKGKSPTITSTSTQSFALSQFDTFDVTTSGYPVATITETGSLPSGVTFVDNHDGTATIEGTPASTAAGNYTLALSASNGVGSAGTQTFVLKVAAASAPTFTGPTTASFTVGTAGTFTVTTTGTPTATISKSGTLPDGLTFHDNNNGTATISGTPATDTDGTYSLSLTARNGATVKKTYLIDVN